MHLAHSLKVLISEEAALWFLVHRVKLLLSFVSQIVVLNLCGRGHLHLLVQQG